MTWATRALRARPAATGLVAACVVVLATAWVWVLALVRGHDVSSGVLLPLALLGGLVLWDLGRDLARSLAREVALLRVRGSPPLRIVSGCGLPLLLVVSAATGAGLGLGALALRLTAAGLHARSGLPQDAAFWLGVVGLAAGALGVVLLSMGIAMSAPLSGAVTGQPVRRTRHVSGVLAGALLLVTTVVVLRDASAGDSAWSVLVAPVLLGLLAAEVLILLLTRAGPVLARLVERPTLHSWLGLRQLRRLGDTAGAVRLLVASGVLCGFAVTSAMTADDWVADTAVLETGAAHRFEFDGSAAQAIALTEELDPAGRYLVAAAFLDDGAADVGPAVWVDALRYPNVATDLHGTPAEAVPAAAGEVAVGGSSTVTTGTELSVSARFVSGRPATVRVDLGYVNGDNFSDTATVRLEAQRGTRVHGEVALEGCGRGCALRSLTIRSDGQTSVRFQSVTVGATDLLRSGWSRVEPPRRSAFGDDDTLDYFLDPGHYLALRPPGSDGPVPVVMAGDVPPYELATAGARDHPARVVGRADALPLAGGAGALGDLRYRLGEAPTVASADVTVLAASGTPQTMLDQVAEASGGDRLEAADVDAEIATSVGLATSWALAGVGGAGLLLAALGGLGVRPRLRELVRADEAALRRVGLTPTTLLDARRRRAAAVTIGVAATVLLGAYVATIVLLPELPLAAPGDFDMPAWPTSVHWVPLLLVAALPAAAATWSLVGPRPTAGDSEATEDVSDVGRSSGLPRVVARGLRTRILLSTGVLLLTGLAIGSAVLGPTFAKAVTSSYLVTRIDESPVSQTGLSWIYQPGPGSAPPTSAAGTVSELLDARTGPYFAAPTAEVASTTYPYRGAELSLFSKPGACRHLEVTGRCPAGPDEAMLATDDLRTLGLEVSDRIPGAPGGGTLTLVGSYEAPEGESEYWVDTSRLATSPALDSLTLGSRPFRPSPAIVTAEAFDGLPTDSWMLRFDSLLDVGPDATPADLERAAATAVELAGTDESVAGGHLGGQVALNDLPAIADELAAQQDTARSSIAPAMISLVVVALALLTRLLMAVNLLRVPELALASLRGASGRRLWSLALAEPLVLIVAAIPLGVALGLVGVRLLAGAWLVPGLPITLPGTAVGAAILVVLAAVGVSAAVVWQLLRLPLAGQLAGVQRPPSRATAGHAARVGLWLVVAIATVLLAVRVVTSDSGTPDVAGMLLPILVAVTVGAVAAQAIAWLARVLARRRLFGRSLVTFVATRSVSRRGENALVILPLSVAVAICVFAVGVFGAAAGWRESVSATTAPADQVWTSPLSPRANADLVRQVDPDGRWLMAASFARYPSARVVLVDGHRLDRTTVWPDQWTDDATAAQIGAELAGTGEEPPVVTGRRLGVTVEGSPGATPVFVTADLHQIGGLDREVSLGQFGPRSSVEVPIRQCEQGCELQALTVGGEQSFPLRMEGNYRVSIEVDGKPWSGLEHAESWSRPASVQGETPIRDVRVDDGVLNVSVDTGDASDRATLQPFSAPERVPVVVGEDAELTEVLGEPALRLTDESLVVDPVATATSIPFAGPNAVLADFRQFTATEDLFADFTDSYVLARDDTPSEVTDALLGAGLVKTGAYAQEKQVQDSTAYAVALRLYAVVAVLVLLMAIAGLAVSIAVQLPTRRRDAAALRVVGVRRRTIMFAVATEQAAVLAATAVAGLVSGFLATQVLLRSITLGTVEGVATPSVSSDVDWVILALQTGVALTLLLGTAAVSSLLTVRGARGSTLRENAR